MSVTAKVVKKEGIMLNKQELLKKSLTELNELLIEYKDRVDAVGLVERAYITGLKDGLQHGVEQILKELHKEVKEWPFSDPVEKDTKNT